MSDLLFYDLEVFALILLAILLIVIYVKQELYTLKGRLFRYLVMATMLMLLLEMLSWAFDGRAGVWNMRLNWTFNTLFTMLSVLVASLWASYIDYMMFGDRKRLAEQAYIYFAPVFVTVMLAILNLFFPILFTIDTNNVYAREPGIWTGAILIYLIYFYVVVLVYRNRKQLTTNFLYGVLLFLVLPLVASFIQLTNLGLLLIWPSTALAVVFSYLLFETTSGTIDYLTGVYTRSRAEDYLMSLINKQKDYAVLMIDMDDFKELNDTYGHHAGDMALIEMAQILTRFVFKGDIVSRFGGDEFLIISEHINPEEIERYRAKIYDLMAESKNDYIKNARFSLGISSSKDELHESVETMLTRADNSMYIDKAKNKNFKRRKDDK